MRGIWALGVGLMCLLLCGCPPRGETRSLQEVFELAKQRYSNANKQGLPGEVAAALQTLDGQLEQLLGNSDGRSLEKVSLDVASLLSGLIVKAGYTSRPSMGELAAQYRMLSAAQHTRYEKQALKLLAQRTYSLLASELETTRFGL